MIYLQLLSDFFLRKFLRLYIFLFSPLAYFGLSQCIFGMFLSRIFSSLSPYQGQKLCFLTFLNIKSDFSPPLFYKARLLPPKPRFLRRFFCSLQRKYRAALCITKCSYPRLLLSWGSYRENFIYFSIFLLAEGISFHPEISTVPIFSQFFCKRRFLPQKTAFAPLPCCLS